MSLRFRLLNRRFWVTKLLATVYQTIGPPLGATILSGIVVRAKRGIDLQLVLIKFRSGRPFMGPVGWVASAIGPEGFRPYERSASPS